ncbi:MAG: GspH/FimT family pseudopilin [Ectothiorhodospiraceae bacterium]|nr:GspH/FimT family pseudopilin [Ectothiorhodospiraceae bacterium]
MDRRFKGLSLIELIVTLLVVAVLAATVMPALGRTVAEYRVVAGANAFLAAIHLTRSEAILRSERVTLCASADGVSCTPGAGYHAGYLVFVGPPGPHLVVPPDAVLRSKPGSARLTMTGNGSMEDYISFVGSGVTRQLNGALQMGAFRFCDGEHGRRIVVSRTGRPRVEEGGCH